MKINWDEQPTPEHVWIEDLHPDHIKDSSGWCTKAKEGYRDDEDDLRWVSEEGDGYYKVHRRPGPEFKQGDRFISSGGAEMVFIGVDSGNAYVCETAEGGLTRLYDFVGCKKKESERDKFIRILGILIEDYTDPGKLYDAGFRYTGDKE